MRRRALLAGASGALLAGCSGLAGRGRETADPEPYVLSFIDISNKHEASGHRLEVVAVVDERRVYEGEFDLAPQDELGHSADVACEFPDEAEPFTVRAALPNGTESSVKVDGTENGGERRHMRVNVSVMNSGDIDLSTWPMERPPDCDGTPTGTGTDTAGE